MFVCMTALQFPFYSRVCVRVQTFVCKTHVTIIFKISIGLHRPLPPLNLARFDLFSVELRLNRPCTYRSVRPSFPLSTLPFIGSDRAQLGRCVPGRGSGPADLIIAGAGRVSDADHYLLSAYGWRWEGAHYCFSSRL